MDRSFSNEPANNELSLNNIVTSLLHNSGGGGEQTGRKRDLKMGEKLSNNNNLNAHENSAGLFNFASGSFRPKDNSEGTILSIKRLRKRSLDLPES